MFDFYFLQGFSVLLLLMMYLSSIDSSWKAAI